MSSISRRELLWASVVAVPLTSLPLVDGGRIFAAADLLSEESARGYDRILSRQDGLYVVTGDIGVPKSVAQHVFAGAVLVRELPTAAFHESDELYVRYAWPIRAMVRHFGSAQTSEHCGEPVAHVGSQPSAWRRRYGRGTIVTLATLLGPNLLAGDPQALKLAAEIGALRS